MEQAGSHNSAEFKPYPGNKYQLVEDFEYIWVNNGVKHKLKVPAGQIWDGASIPLTATVLTKILPGFETIYPMGMHAYATLGHDYIWEYKGRLPEGAYEVQTSQGWVDARYDKKGKPVWTFKTSNKLFARMLREDGVGTKERRAMYLAVQYTPIAWWKWKTGKLPEDAGPKRMKV